MELRERVARALFDRAHPGGRWDREPGGLHDVYRRRADSALGVIETELTGLRADLLTAQRDRDRIHAELEAERKEWAEEREALTRRLETVGRIDAAKTWIPPLVWHTFAKETEASLRDVIVSQALEITRLKGEDA